MSHPNLQPSKRVFDYARRALLAAGMACVLCMPAHAAEPPVAVYVVYERNPAALFLRKTSGLISPRNALGKKLGAPVFDGGRKLWPLYSQLAETGDVKWESVDAAKREEAFAKGSSTASLVFISPPCSILSAKARLAFDRFVITPTVQESGLGTINMRRVQSAIDAVSAAYKLPSKSTAAAIARLDFLPPAKERAVQ